jgi:hypothetical protein
MYKRDCVQVGFWVGVTCFANQNQILLRFKKRYSSCLKTGALSTGVYKLALRSLIVTGSTLIHLRVSSLQVLVWLAKNTVENL